MNQPTPYYLKPGFLYASRDASEVTTILGSCVAVCLYDRRRGWGGMNHYLHPEAHRPDDRTTSYGNVAIRVLVNTLLDFGSDRRDLTAFVLGGASMEDSSTSLWVATQNIQMARTMLQDLGNIPIVLEETGGHRGRKLLFHTQTADLDWGFLPSGIPVE